MGYAKEYTECTGWMAPKSFVGKKIHSFALNTSQLGFRCTYCFKTQKECVLPDKQEPINATVVTSQEGAQYTSSHGDIYMSCKDMRANNGRHDFTWNHVEQRYKCLLCLQNAQTLLVPPPVIVKPKPSPKFDECSAGINAGHLFVDGRCEYCKRVEKECKLEVEESMLISAEGSSAISFFGYNAATRVLVVIWVGGSISAFDSVPPVVYNGLLTAKSKGQFVNQNIKGFFQSRLLDLTKLN